MARSSAAASASSSRELGRRGSRPAEEPPRGVVPGAALGVIFTKKQPYRIYLAESYRACAILTMENGIPYLDKFAVEQALGRGIGGSIWNRFRRENPKLFWRSRSNNPINTWYAQKADGLVKQSKWWVFCCPANDFAEIQPTVERRFRDEGDLTIRRPSRPSRRRRSRLVDHRDAAGRGVASCSRKVVLMASVGIVGARGYTGRSSSSSSPHTRVSRSRWPSPRVTTLTAEDIAKTNRRHIYVALPNGACQSWPSTPSSRRARRGTVDISADKRFDDNWVWAARAPPLAKSRGREAHLEGRLLRDRDTFCDRPAPRAHGARERLRREQLPARQDHPVAEERSRGPSRTTSSPTRSRITCTSGRVARQLDISCASCRRPVLPRDRVHHEHHVQRAAHARGSDGRVRESVRRRAASSN